MINTLLSDAAFYAYCPLSMLYTSQWGTEAVNTFKQEPSEPQLFQCIILLVIM